MFLCLSRFTKGKLTLYQKVASDTLKQILKSNIKIVKIEMINRLKKYI